MARFVVTLTADERDNLEAWRAALGLRSMAEVVRHWAAQPAPSRIVPVAELHDVRAKAPIPPKVSVSAPYAGDIKQKPMQKGGKR